MMNSIVLYKEERSDISIHIMASIIGNGDLRIEGRDIGKLVKELQGDSDYEYNLSVSSDNVELLRSKLKSKKVELEDDRQLLEWLKNNFSTNECFSNLKSFLEREEISFDIFTWT